MARLRLGAVSLAALMILAATTAVAGAALREPRFSDTIALDLPEDPFRLVGSDLNGDGNADLASVNWNSSSVSVLLSRGDGNFAKRVDYRAPRHPAGIAVGDINGDGRPDLVTAGHDRAGAIVVWLNSGGGSFVRAGTYAAGGYAWAVAVADVNGDGVLDLLTAHHGRQQLAVLIGIGDGRFHGARRYAGAGARELVVGDLNRDGKLDVMLGTRGKRHVAVRFGAGGGSFSAPRNYKVGLKNPALALADFNHDEIPDLATGSESLTVMLGNGDGTLRLGWRPTDDEGGFGLEGVTPADFNGDGNLDLLASGYPPDLLLGGGDGKFHTYEVGEEQAGALDLDAFAGSPVAADFNGDGRPDPALLAFCDYDCDYGTVVLWLNWTGLPAKPCVVPDVTQYLPIAGTLRDYGCRLGRVTHRHSQTVPRGWAISQAPRPGVVLQSFAPVDVVVSRGRRHKTRRR
jgi:hypothetical protein